MTLVQLRPWGSRYARLVAEEVRGVAARKRVTGVQLAEAVGVSPQSMSRRMTGSLPFSIDELAEVARVLEVSVVDLLPTQRTEDQRQVTHEKDAVTKRVGNVYYLKFQLDDLALAA